MTESSELPEDIVAAIRANRKIEAIKLLREERGLGLKEAKHAVEAWERSNPGSIDAMPQLRETGANPLFIIIVIAIAGYLIYRFFA